MNINALHRQPQRLPIVFKFVLIAMLTIIASIVLFLIYVRYLEYTTAFVPSKIVSSTPAQYDLAFEDVTFKTRDNVDLNGWFINGTSIPKKYKVITKGVTLIFLHGNAGNIGDRLVKAEFFAEYNFNVFLIDYRGYGKSKGRPSENGLYQDAVAAFDYLLTRKDVDLHKIIVYGESLGGAVAIDLAAKRPVAGLIIDASFSSAEDMARRIFPFIPTFLVKLKFDSASKIKTVTVPKLFIHSSEDEVVPYDLGFKLFNAAPDPKRFLQITGGHNDNFVGYLTVYSIAMIDFLKDLKYISEHDKLPDFTR